MGNEQKRKFIFLANPTVGHTSFLISLALKAKENGSEVLFMLPGVTNTFIRNILNNPSLNIDSKLKNSSIPYKIIPISLSQAILGLILPYKRGRKEVAFALNFFSAGSLIGSPPIGSPTAWINFSKFPVFSLNFIDITLAR